ncbi:MAG: hypothetical protein ABR978_04590 [Dehalococcoidia bacterium]|jgi:pimeloyl-ACP methyl ester carboxylesterase
MSELPDRRSRALRRAWPLAVALVILATIGTGLSCTTYGRTAVTSAFFLPDLMAPLPVRPVTWATDQPVVEHITLNYGSYQMPADVYRPGSGGQHGAMILSPGAPPLEPDDSRLVRLAGDVSRAGFVMLVPFSPDLEDEMIYPREVEAQIAAFEYLKAQPYVDATKIGYIGVSVGSPLALLAAADPRINDEVAFVVSFGGYYDTFDLLSAVTTGVISYGGHEESWQPSSHTVEVMFKQIINRLDDAGDRYVLTNIFIDGQPEEPGDVAGLTPEGRAAYDLLTNRDPAQVQTLLDRLPPKPLQALQDLSLKGRLQGLKAETFVLHDRTDHYIPYVESRRLRDALEGQVKLHFTEVNIFDHVEPTANRAARTLVVDSTKLYFHLYQLLLRFT